MIYMMLCHKKVSVLHCILYSPLFVYFLLLTSLLLSYVILKCGIATTQQCLYVTPHKTVYFSDIPQEKTIKTSSNSRRGQRAACPSL